MDLSKIYKNFFIASVSRFITSIIGLVIIGFLTRHLGQSNYGSYETILSYLFIFTVLADFGLHIIHVREISRYPEKEKHISGNIFTLRLISLALVVVLAAVIGFFLPYEQEVKKGILIASIFVIFSSLSQILAGIFQKYSTFYYVSFSDILTRLVQLSLVVYAIRQNSSLLVFVWILSLTALLQFFIIFFISRRFVKFSFKLDFAYAKKIIKTSFPVAISILFTAIYIRTDALMLSLMKPQADVGIYRLAAKVVEAIVFFPALLVELTMPSLSVLSGKDSLNNVFRRTFNILFLMAIPVATILLFFAEPISLVLGGKEFAASAAPLRIMALVVGMVFLNNLGGKALVALEFQKAGMWIYFSGAVLNIFSNFLVIPKYSYIGASWTTLMTEIIVTVMMFLILYKKTRLRPDLKKIFIDFKEALKL